MQRLALFFIYLASAVWALPSNAQTVNAIYNFGQFNSQIVNVVDLSITAIPPAAGYVWPGSFTTNTFPVWSQMDYSRAQYPTLTNGAIIVSNLLTGYPYQVQISTFRGIFSYTNYFGTNLSGTVSAATNQAFLIGAVILPAGAAGPPGPANTNLATATTPGMVQPDNVTTFVNSQGVISAVGGSGNTNALSPTQNTLLTNAVQANLSGVITNTGPTNATSFTAQGTNAIIAQVTGANLTGTLTNNTTGNAATATVASNVTVSGISSAGIVTNDPTTLNWIAANNITTPEAQSEALNWANVWKNSPFFTNITDHFFFDPKFNVGTANSWQGRTITYSNCQEGFAGIVTHAGQVDVTLPDSRTNTIIVEWQASRTNAPNATPGSWLVGVGNAASGQAEWLYYGNWMSAMVTSNTFQTSVVGSGFPGICNPWYDSSFDYDFWSYNQVEHHVTIISTDGNGNIWVDDNGRNCAMSVAAQGATTLGTYTNYQSGYTISGPATTLQIGNSFGLTNSIGGHFNGTIMNVTVLNTGGPIGTNLELTAWWADQELHAETSRDIFLFDSLGLEYSASPNANTNSAPYFYENAANKVNAIQWNNYAHANLATEDFENTNNYYVFNTLMAPHGRINTTRIWDALGVNNFFFKSDSPQTWWAGITNQLLRAVAANEEFVDISPRQISTTNSLWTLTGSNSTVTANSILKTNEFMFTKVIDRNVFATQANLDNTNYSLDGEHFRGSSGYLIYSAEAVRMAEAFGIYPTLITGIFTGDGSGLTNLVNANLVVAGSNVTISSSTNAATSQITSTISASGGGSGSQTPLIQPVNAAGYAITNIAYMQVTGAATNNSLVVTSTITAGGAVTAGSFVGPLTGNASTATTATSFSGSLAGDVTGTQNATVISVAPASAITGTIATANLGTGTASSSTFLRGNQTYSALATGDMPSSVPTSVTVTTANGLTNSSSLTGNVLTLSIGQTNLWPLTNNLAAAAIIDASIPEVEYSTNASFTFGLPINTSVGKYNNPVVDVTNSSGSAITITTPASWHIIGTWYCTNMSKVVLSMKPLVWTNANCIPIW